jgi:hypothetical protein
MKLWFSIHTFLSSIDDTTASSHKPAIKSSAEIHGWPIAGLHRQQVTFGQKSISLW